MALHAAFRAVALRDLLHDGKAEAGNAPPPALPEGVIFLPDIRKLRPVDPFAVILILFSD